jgi:hypothetical protein
MFLVAFRNLATKFGTFPGFGLAMPSAQIYSRHIWPYCALRVISIPM